MERDEDHNDIVITLGVASEVTQGPPGVYLEMGIAGDQPPALDAE